MENHLRRPTKTGIHELINLNGRFPRSYELLAKHRGSDSIVIRDQYWSMIELHKQAIYQ